MTEIDVDAARAARRYSGPVFFEYGFRPFFLGAGVLAVLAMLAWMAWITLQRVSDGPVGLSIAVPVHQWHAHEMIFGYALAVVAGFFLTAVPNWTGRQPVRGRTLAILFALWLLARLTGWTSAVVPPALVALPELGFLAMLATLIGHALLSGWSKRNFVFLPVLIALILAAALYHLEAAGVADNTAAAGHLLAIDALLVLVTVVGGRIVPAFTTNVLRRHEITPLPRAMDKRDAVAILLVVALLVADLAAPGSAAAGWVSAAAGIAGALRMIGWRAARVLWSPILWVLHLGYGWLVLGLLLKGLALTTGIVPEVLALHALTVGAVGSMTLGVMTRAALGHTGRPLKVSGGVAVSYLLLSLAAATRILGPLLFESLYDASMILSGLLWSTAFVVFTIAYWPILTRPRVTGGASA